MRIDRARFTRKIVPPYAREQLLAREHLAGVGREHVQDLDLLGRADDRLAAQRDGIALEIDGQAVVGDDAAVALWLLARAAQHRLDARHDLARAEGLDDVIVRAQLEPDDAVDLLALCGEHQDGELRALADLAAHLDAGHLGHHDVEHAQHDLRRDGGKRLLAVVCVHGLKPLRLEIDAKRLMDDLVVVRDQDLLCHICTASPSGMVSA